MAGIMLHSLSLALNVGPISTRTRCADPTMCGILAVSGAKMGEDALKLQTLALQRLVRHRGLEEQLGGEATRCGKAGSGEAGGQEAEGEDGRSEKICRG